MSPRDLSIDDINVGDTAEFERTWSDSDVADFARISGDINPLHTDDEYASTTKFKKRLVHGMLLGALCSTFVSMYLPGKRCLYLKQDISFKKPVFIGDTVKISGKVVAKSSSTGILTISINISRDIDIVATGEAHVQVI